MDAHRRRRILEMTHQAVERLGMGLAAENLYDGRADISIGILEQLDQVGEDFR
jgi:hypothetical protein